MEILDAAIKNYIHKSYVDYALLVTGQWGSGKTYYWKEITSKHLKERNLKPIYVSLNGIKNIEEVKNKIYVQGLMACSGKIHNFINSPNSHFMRRKFQNTLGHIGSNLTRATVDILKTTTGINLSETFNLNIMEDFIEYDKIVICFDDLERVAMDGKELFGGLNEFIEHRQAKVIILTNEEKMSENTFLNEYASIKEKFIGKTILFIPDIKQTIESLLSEVIEESRSAAFLKENQSKMINVIEKSQLLNFRIIKHFIDEYHMIYNFIQEKNIDADEKVKLCKNTMEFMLAVLLENAIRKVPKECEIFFSEEYRAKKLLDRINKDKEAEKIHKMAYEFYENFIKKYGFMEIMSPEIVRYVRTSFFDKKTFEMKYIRLKEKSQNYINEFLNQHYSMFEDDEFEEMLNCILAEAKEGNYPLEAYPLIYNKFLIMDNDNVHYKDLEEVKTLLHDGMENVKNCNCESKFDFELMLNRCEQKNDDYTKLVKFVEERKNKLSDQENKIKIDNLSDTIQNNVMDFIREAEKFYKNSILSQTISTYIIEILKSGNNKDIRNLLTFFNQRYDFGNYYKYFKDEKKYLQTISAGIAEIQIVEQRPIKNKLLCVIKELLDSTYKKIENNS